MRAVGRQAIVLGASVGGLLAARVLADHFAKVTVIERDVLPDGAAARRGTPQALHPHALLTKGAHILDQLFPGLLGALVDQGAPVWDDGDWSKLYMSIAGHVMLRQGLAAFDHKQMSMYFPSRPLLEAAIRRRVEAIDNVDIRGGTDVAELTVTADRRRVTGVTVTDGDGTASQDLAFRDENRTGDVCVVVVDSGARPIRHTPRERRRIAHRRVEIGQRNIGYDGAGPRLSAGITRTVLRRRAAAG
jgi:2-polyprenyl-6-methoxyphenol hydroxylase-like FAD-dependent oxidoreductase